jgi:signal transduction histidine kinase
MGSRATRYLAAARSALESFRLSLARPIDRKVLAAMLSPLLVVVVAVLAFGGVQAVRETQGWITHTREVIDLLQRTQLFLVDAETEQRAYLITNDDRYLDSYLAAVKQVDAMLGSLKGLLPDNPAQLARADEVALRVRSKLAQLALTIDLFKREGVGGARAFILSGHGKLDMDEVRTAINVMIAAERALLVERNQRRDQEVSYTLWVIAAGSVLAVLLALALNVGIRHDVTEQRRNQALLEEQSARLEAQRNSLEESERALAHQLEAERRLSDRLASASAAAESALQERNAASAAMERSNRELNQFAYVASHDLKAPLRGIANLAQWVEEDVGAAMPETSREHIRVLLSRVQRMESLIDGILAYARAGQGAGQREEIDVGQLVQETVEMLAPPTGSFHVDVQHGLPRVNAARAPFQQIWMNLLGNAFKHARRDGAEVRIRAEDRGADWEFSVADNGPGIEPQYHQRVFGIFQTLLARDKVEGTGIGLATVKKLVEREGGQVRVESQLGEGATFHFTWPKVQATTWADR